MLLLAHATRRSIKKAGSAGCKKEEIMKMIAVMVIVRLMIAIFRTRRTITESDGRPETPTRHPAEFRTRAEGYRIDLLWD
jgi:hypothetical protein